MALTPGRAHHPVAARLALDGGVPVRTRPIRTTPGLSQADVDAATRVLSSGQLAGPDHPEVRRFESALAQSSGVAHAVALNSGTAAIHCILQAVGVRPGDEVIVPAVTFAAAATPVLSLGATPVIADVDKATYCIDPAAVDAATSHRTRAIVAVHLNGHPAPVDLLPAHVAIVGDACQAHGATLFGQPVGALGEAAAFSFWQDKIVTAAGEGGAVATGNPAIADAAILMRSHALRPIPGTPNSHHVSLGFNYRLTGVQAAVGRSQIERLPSLVEARRHNAQRLADLLSGTPGIVLPASREGATHVFWKFVIAIEADRYRVDRHGFVRALVAEGIAAAARYPIPLTRQPVMEERARTLPCPVSDALADRLITLPLPATLADSDDVVDVAEALTKVATAMRR